MPDSIRNFIYSRIEKNKVIKNREKLDEKIEPLGENFEF